MTCEKLYFDCKMHENKINGLNFYTLASDYGISGDQWTSLRPPSHPLIPDYGHLIGIRVT